MRMPQDTMLGTAKLLPAPNDEKSQASACQEKRQPDRSESVMTSPIEVSQPLAVQLVHEGATEDLHCSQDRKSQRLLV